MAASLIQSVFVRVKGRIGGVGRMVFRLLFIGVPLQQSKISTFRYRSAYAPMAALEPELRILVLVFSPDLWGGEALLI